MGVTTSSSTTSFDLSITLCDPPVECPCCGEEDTQVPCRDCQLWCDENEWCKARGLTKLRLRIARGLSWLSQGYSNEGSPIPRRAGEWWGPVAFADVPGIDWWVAASTQPCAGRTSESEDRWENCRWPGSPVGRRAGHRLVPPLAARLARGRRRTNARRMAVAFAESVS